MDWTLLLILSILCIAFILNNWPTVPAPEPEVDPNKIAAPPPKAPTQTEKAIDVVQEKTDTITCGKCQQHNISRARYCRRCGVRMAHTLEWKMGIPDYKSWSIYDATANNDEFAQHQRETDRAVELIMKRAERLEREQLIGHEIPDR